MLHQMERVHFHGSRNVFTLYNPTANMSPVAGLKVEIARISNGENWLHLTRASSCNFNLIFTFSRSTHMFLLLLGEFEKILIVNIAQESD